MKIGLFHGYELSGSGSNEYVRYLARTLAQAGHEIHIICREPNPKSFDFINKGIKWELNGDSKILFDRESTNGGKSILHQLPSPSINAVYLTDKQRPGNVKSFGSLTDEELKLYHQFVVNSLIPVLKAYPVEILHTNHIVYQPVAAAEVCPRLGIPFIIFPHGSAIEYTLRSDNRYKKLALEAIKKADGLIIGNFEVRDRILKLYPDSREKILAKTEIVGVGVDTSLFLPVKKNARNNKIEKLFSKGPFDGKPAELSDVLFSQLDKGQWETISNFRKSYQNNFPDRNFIDHLKKIPWENGKILLFVGALTVGKGIQSLIVSLPFILRQNPNIHFVIVGSGAYREVLEALIYAITKKDEKLLEHLIQNGYDLDQNELTGCWEDIQHFLTKSNIRDELFTYGSNLQDHVHFLGRLDHDLLRFVFPCADFAIFPSTFPEAYPLVIIESLSNGVFPLASYFSGLADSIDSLIPFFGQKVVNRMKIPIDAEKRIPGLISNLTNLLADESIVELKKSLRKVAEENFDWEIITKQMVAAYSKFVSRD